MPTTTGMKGGGFYDAHSSAQLTAIESILPRLESALDTLPEPTASGYTWMDVGSSEGGNAILVARRLIQRLRQRTDAPLCLIFDDLPTNDFNQLFANLYPDGAPALADSNVFPSASGGSAFGRLAPAGSLHVATTFNAIGFLEQKPTARIPNYILPQFPGPAATRDAVAVTDTELTPFREEAARNLEAFFLARAKELVPGGKLLTQVFARNEETSTSHGIYDVLSDALLDFVEEGRLPRAFYENLLIPVYMRDLDELLKPLSANTELAAAFRVEHSESREVPTPFTTALDETGDVTAWAHAYMSFMRAFTEAIVAADLPGDAARSETISALYARVEERLKAEPERYPFQYVSIAVLLTRM